MNFRSYPANELLLISLVSVNVPSLLLSDEAQTLEFILYPTFFFTFASHLQIILLQVYSSNSYSEFTT